MSRPQSHLELRRPAKRTGTATVLLLLLLLVIIIMVAFTVDVGLMVLLHAEVQNAVDSGALAAGLELREDPQAVQKAEDTAKRFIRLNRVGMARLIPDDLIDVEQGVFDSEANTFATTTTSPNAVRVFARQEHEPFFFAWILGQTTFGAPASGVASSAFPSDIMLVLDLSGSMKNEGRIEALWSAAPAFVDVIDQSGGNDQIGVVGLAADPEQYDPVEEGHTGVVYASGLHPTSDHYVGVLEAILTKSFSTLKSTTLSSANLEAGKYTGWTGTGAAIGDAAHYLTNGAEARDEAEKFIVLMSDGQANKPSGNGPDYARTMAAYAAGLDVTIYTISLGSGADVNLMQELAQITEGTHFDATGSGQYSLTAELTEAFKQAAAAIKRVQLVK